MSLNVIFRCVGWAGSLAVMTAALPELAWKAPSQLAEAAPLQQGLSRQSFVADAVARTGPAVVTLETARTVQRSGLPSGLLRDPLFRRFFGDAMGGGTPRERVQRGRLDVYVRRSAVESGQTVHPDPVLAER